MLVEPTRPDGDDVGTFLVEHLAVVGITLPGPRLGDGRSTPPFVLVGHRDDVCLRDGPPECIDSVTVIPFPGPADDRDAVLLIRHGLCVL